MSTPTVPLSSVVALLEAEAPLALAEPWDNVGMILHPGGDPEVRRALLAIDLTPSVAEEAEAGGFGLVVAYHPPLFAPVRRLAGAGPVERAVIACARAGIAIWSPHTALDAVPGGTSDWLANMVGEGEMTVLHPRPDRPEAGMGRIVRLAEEAAFGALATRIAAELGVSSVEVAGRPDTAWVRTVAVCPGAGAEVVADSGADAVLTGEMKHHDLLALAESGVGVILAGHTETERGFLPVWRDRLERTGGLPVEWRVSTRDRGPGRRTVLGAVSDPGQV